MTADFPPHEMLVKHIEGTRTVLFEEIEMLRAELDFIKEQISNTDRICAVGYAAIGAHCQTLSATIANLGALSMLYFDLYPDSTLYEWIDPYYAKH